MYVLYGTFVRKSESNSLMLEARSYRRHVLDVRLSRPPIALQLFNSRKNDPIFIFGPLKQPTIHHLYRNHHDDDDIYSQSKSTNYDYYYDEEEDY
jgi:hypothetical protein